VKVFPRRRSNAAEAVATLESDHHNRVRQEGQLEQRELSRHLSSKLRRRS
jgi:hypothetical protein